jgi:hypothetical protein
VLFTSLLMGKFGLQVGVIAVGSRVASWSSGRLQRLGGLVSGLSGQPQAAASSMVQPNEPTFTPPSPTFHPFLDLRRKWNGRRRISHKIKDEQRIQIFYFEHNSCPFKQTNSWSRIRRETAFAQPALYWLH